MSESALFPPRPNAPVSDAFERARPWLTAALHATTRPLYTISDVETDLAANEARLWIGERSCILTKVNDYASTGERVLEIWLGGGDLAEIREAIPTLEDWARRAGCTQATIDGRRGWLRTLAPFGFREYTTVVRKILT